MPKSKKIILASMLLALQIVLSRFFSIETQFLVLSFGFVPIIMSAIWLGPKYSTLIAALGDFIGAILFPFGAYFPGFTVSAAISGWIYGMFLYNGDTEKKMNNKFLLRLIVSSILVLLCINVLLNSLWLHILYGKAYLVIIGTRALSQLVILPIQILIIYNINKYIRNFLKNAQEIGINY